MKSYNCNIFISFQILSGACTGYIIPTCNDATYYIVIVILHSLQML